MEKQQTEAFRRFVETKKGEISDFLCLLEKCADKVELLEDYFLFRDHEDFEMNENMANGMAGILGNVRSDLRLLVAEMMTDVDKHVAEFQKRRAEEKKEGPQVHA